MISSILGAGNIIAFNAGDGVTIGNDPVTKSPSTGDAILGNSIHDNDGLGIELVGDSDPTGTPPGTNPTGPNLFQNAPVLALATNSQSGTTITGTLSAAASTTFRIEFFSNPAGTSQGQTYLGFLDVTSNGSGSASFQFSTATVVAAGLNITATATDPGGNTSEFSPAATVNNVTNALSVRFGGFVFNRARREFSQTLTITNTGGTPLAGPIELVLLGLKNATLANASGMSQGNPYITILSSGSLGVGQSLTVTLIFTDPTLASITYTPEFFMGPLPTDDD